MRARDLSYPARVATLDDDLVAAIRRMADAAVPGLIVLDERGRPHAVLPSSQVLRLLVPVYLQEDPALAGALDEKASLELSRHLAGRTVRDALRDMAGRELPSVEADATLLEVAAVMARLRSPVVAVLDDGQMVGAVTATALLLALVGDEGPA